MISQNDYSSKLNNFFGFMFIFMAYINPKVSQYDLEKKGMFRQWLNAYLLD